MNMNQAMQARETYMFLMCEYNLDQDSNVQVSICMDDPYQDSNVAFNQIEK